MLNNVTFLQNFIDDLPVGIARHDTTGKLPNHFNNFLLDMIGWCSEEIDTMEKWFTKVYPDEIYRKKLIQLWTDALADTAKSDRAYSSTFEIKMTCKDGTVKCCEARSYTKGNFVYATFVDISQRKELEEKLRQQSLQDGLTGVYNRRYFNLTFYDRWCIAQRQKSSISLIICDVDNFKQVNDENGHLVGDAVLKTIAQAIQTSLKRSSDFVARFGGEEFVVVSCGGDNTSSIKLCQLIQENVRKASTCQIKDITLSYGIHSVFPDESSTPQEFINSADKALYEAKTSGKNKIVVYS